ncbi:hypothetical protein HN011_009477 [Eciton burchellii]|nr:hypothetical protein HN011_009477 [Eciton burchellii]
MYLHRPHSQLAAVKLVLIVSGQRAISIKEPRRISLYLAASRVGNCAFLGKTRALTNCQVGLAAFNISKVSQRRFVVLTRKTQNVLQCCPEIFAPVGQRVFDYTVNNLFRESEVNFQISIVKESREI